MGLAIVIRGLIPRVADCPVCGGKSVRKRDLAGGGGGDISS